MIRSFRPVADGVRERLESDRLDRAALATIWSEPPALRLLGALSLMMVPRGGRGAFGPPRGDGDRQGAHEINQLLDTAFGALAGILTPFFESSLRERAEKFDNLTAYVDRMMAQYYPEFAWKRVQEAQAA